MVWWGMGCWLRRNRCAGQGEISCRDALVWLAECCADVLQRTSGFVPELQQLCSLFLCAGHVVCTACVLTSDRVISEVVELGVVLRGPLGAIIGARLVAC